MPESSSQSAVLQSRPGLHFGAAYYPEHWPEQRWPEDIRLMREAGLNVARLAEFAWSTLEPKAGEFDFEWLDRAIQLLADNGIFSVLGTPTAAPPAWLVQENPDLLAVDENGRRVQFGNRCHYCVNSTTLHGAVERLVGAMAKHFADNSNVIGWQIDNEYNRVCYCEHCQELFQQYLQLKYSELEKLNQRWATRYWSQTYSAWEQIPIPIGSHNPGLMLEFKHFVTESYRRFQQLQLDILCPHLKPGVFTTHNFMGWYGGYDHYILARELGMASWDWYIGTGHHDFNQSGATHDLTRGFKRRNFWLIETQPGNVNWAAINNSLNKGEARVMAWHAVAHGADAVCYWEWRSALGGQEQYHGTFVDQSGQPRPFYEEGVQIGREFKALAGLLAGSVVKSRVAMLNDYDSRWSIEWQRHHADYDYVAHFNDYYRPLATNNVNVDVISADEPLDGYKLVIAPALLILNETRAMRLKEFVRRGGFLILTMRTGMKDEFNALLPSRQPGPLAEIAGVEVEDYYALLDPVPVKGNLLEGTSKVWAERLKIIDSTLTIPVARYGVCNGWLDNEPAITVHPYGNGMVYYVGAYLDEGSQQILMSHILTTAGIRVLKTPAAVEVRTRINDAGQEIYFVLNHDPTQQAVPWPWPMYDHLSHQEIKGDLLLPPYGVAILTKNTT